MEPKNYETIFILDPVLTQEQLANAKAKFRGFLIEKEAKIVYEKSLGLKKLAYPIQHKSTGVYHVIEFQATPAVIRALETAYKRDERIIRFLTLLLDKHGVEYNEKQRETAKISQHETVKEMVV